MKTINKTRNYLSISIFIVISIIASGCGDKEAIQKLQAENEQYKEVLEISTQKEAIQDELLGSTVAINEVYDKLMYLSNEQIKDPTKRNSVTSSVLISTLDSLTSLIRNSKSKIESLEKKIGQIELQNPNMKLSTAAIRNKLSELKDQYFRHEGEVKSLYTNVATVAASDKNLTANDKKKLEQATGAPLGTTMQILSNEGHYIVGNEEELKKADVVVEEGGAKLWVFGKVGTALVPAKEMKENHFSKIMIHDQTIIRFPRKAKDYRIVSAHNPKLLKPNFDNDEHIVSVTVLNTSKFWYTSPYLIIAIDD
ncbi:MAG TPA: hypothetical protein PLW09_01765 [Candidatus Kapabacteria bacterium]|jgi:hypothetical protein|nr:hypothetical protein [Ignavibacteria bacterium]HRE56520.1 hypothetical protein [Candidatus Kapabacteria bacterium]HRI30192.1 hypothetical protein [Candidatus Kapabacteria bacterium]